MNTKTIIGLIILLPALTCCLTACSVKENRAECPCFLIMDFSEVRSSEMRHSDVDIESSDGFLYNDKIPASKYGERHVVAVPRTGVFLNVSYGSENCFSPGNGFLVTDGQNFPPLYLYSSYLDTDAEVVESKVKMHKEHCRINIGMKAVSGPFPFSVSVEGDICGIGMDGTPVSGAFSYSPAINDEGTCYVRVPRQTSSSLILKILDKNDVLRSFSIGEYIIESGYDWTAESLEDVNVEIDYAKTEVSFTVNDWEKTVHFDVEI